MRALPCDNAKCPTHDLPGVRRGKATLRSGEGVYVLGRTPAAFPYRYPCATCKMVTSLTASAWNRIPTLTMAQIDELGMVERLTKDLRGAGFRPGEAADLFGAGFRSPASLEPLEQGRHDPLTPREKRS